MRIAGVALLVCCLASAPALASPDSDKILAISSSATLTTFAAHPDHTAAPAFGLSIRPIDALTIGVELGYRLDLEHLFSGNVVLSSTGLWWWGQGRHHLILGGQIGIDPEEIRLGLPGLLLAPLVGYGLRAQSMEVRIAWSPQLSWSRPRCGPGCSDKAVFDPFAVTAQVAFPIW